jgi:VanZ family protein
MRLFIKYLLAVAWLLLIFALSHEPAGESSARSAVIVDAVAGLAPFASEFLTFLVRKSAHIVAFFTLGVLVYNVVRSYKLQAKYVIAISIACVLAYAIFDEVHQLFVPGRSGEVRDVLLDTAAGAIGVCVFYLAYRRAQLVKNRAYKNRPHPDTMRQ